ncbi:MAG TPA: nucleotidyltransferase family protein [Pyrinomonadaceae bacterium]|nr:nucleotidyltransferase family protein [Pyrinomonadaceae bacterium]
MFADQLLKDLPNPEAELLVHCARLETSPARTERIRLLVSSGLDWTRLLSLAQRHALIPLLYFHLNRSALDQSPPERLKELRTRFQNNSALNVLLTGEMVRLLDLFAQNQIAALPYKGPAIAVGIYGNLSLRQFADLDILVPETEVWRATDLLLNQGYQAHFVIPERKKSTFLRLSYVRLFKRESDGTTVELHWRLAPRFFGAAFETAKLWENGRTIQVQGSNVRIPLVEDFILMLCLHGAKDCWEKLEWVCGLAELVRSDVQIDWGKLFSGARQARCLKAVILGLLLARDLLEAPVPANVLESVATDGSLNLLAQQIVARFFAEPSAPFSLAKRVSFHLKVKDSLPEKLRYCARLALTTTPVDWEMASLPQPVSFVYYPLRVFRLFKKYGWQSDQLAASNRSAGPV